MNCFKCKQPAAWVYGPCTEECKSIDTCWPIHAAYCDLCVPRDCHVCNSEYDPVTDEFVDAKGKWEPCVEFCKI